MQAIPANLGFGEQVIHVVLERGDTSIMYELHITTTRDVPGSQIPRTRTALKVYRKQYLDPFKGKIKYCFEILPPFKKLFKEHV